MFEACAHTQISQNAFISLRQTFDHTDWHEMVRSELGVASTR